jgi:MFS family permease
MTNHVVWKLSRLQDRLYSWLGLKPNIVVMFTMILLVGMGEQLWSRFMPRYLELLGASAWGIAVYGMLHDLLRALYRYPGGWITDRCGRRLALTLFAGLALIGYGVYMVSPTWMWILVGAVFVRAWGSLTLPSVFTIIADSLPEGDRATGFGLQSALNRLPVVLAPPLGGVLIATMGIAGGVRLGLGITVVLTLTAIVVVQRYYVEQASSADETIRFRDVWQEMGRGLKRLLIADILANWAISLPYVFILLYVLKVLEFSALQFGLLTSLQMVTAIAIDIPVAKLADRCPRKPLILAGLACYACFPLVLIHATSLGWIVLAFGLAGLREIGEPARKALIADLATMEIRGRVVGMYYLIVGLVVFPASLVGGWLWALNPQGPFYAAFGLGTAGFLVYLLWGHDVRHRICRGKAP